LQRHLTHSHKRSPERSCPLRAAILASVPAEPQIPTGFPDFFIQVLYFAQQLVNGL
jgi:hypothetical protein